MEVKVIKPIRAELTMTEAYAIVLLIKHGILRVELRHKEVRDE